jgi:epoxyqueuosine reductase
MVPLETKLRESLYAKGAVLIGFADLIEIPAEVRHSMRYGISIAAALNPTIIKNIIHGPTREYLAEYNRVNDLLADLAKETAAILQGCGYEAIAKAPTNAEIDPATHSTPLPHKTVATRAGLGWIGKNALLVTERYGSAVRLSTILTHAPLKTAIPVNRSRCGECVICKEACPGHAPSGINWNVHLYRDVFFNAYECRRTARELAAKVGMDETVCGICIAVCPWTRKYLNGDIS